MDEFTPFYKRAGFWRGFVLWGLFGIFIFLFWDDVGPGIRGWRDLFAVLLGLQAPPVDISLLPSMLRVAVNIVVYIVVFLLTIFIVAQFVLPVEVWKERVSAFWRVIFYWSKIFRGPTVFVHNGRLVSRVGEEDNTNPGVLVVDLRSAVVVEEAYPDLGGEENFSDIPILEKEPSITNQSGGLLRTLRRFRRDPKEYPVARVLGPGIHFTEWGEKIRTTVDLRKQARSTSGKSVVTAEGIKSRQLGVQAFTRDGIEISTNCSVVSSLSDPPDVIYLAYFGGTDRRNLHEVEWEKEENSFLVKRIHSLDFDWSDAEEIHQAVLAARVTPASDQALSLESVSSLYPVDEQRIFNAAYGQVYGDSSHKNFEWPDLSLSIAIDIFRNLLEKYSLDYLYAADDPSRLPWMDEFKPEFSRRAKHQGILSYRLIRPANLPSVQTINWNLSLDSEPLNLKLGEKVSLDSLEFSAVYPLTNPKSLRDRSIKVVAAGFSELKLPPDIREKLVERWKARWEKEIQVVLARQEREVMQIIGNARNRAQRDNAYFLSNLFKQEKYSTEALALLLFQSLELAATDVKNHPDLPPKDVLAMLQNLHNWLLKERQEMNERKKRRKGKDDSDGKEGKEAS